MSTDAIEERVGRALVAAGATLAVAESCTGGLVSHRITSVSGCSAYFKGGVVAYANTVKTAQLGVPEAVLKRKGAVSDGVAGRMASGVRDALDADFGVGITGVAGPGGGTPSKPVGLVFIAVADKKGSVVKRFEFEGSRNEVKQAAARAALALLLDVVTGHEV